VLAAAASGCRVRDLESCVAGHLGVPAGRGLRRRVEAALGLLIVTGRVDEAGGRLTLGRELRRVG
jgi:hypothetical protein